LAKVEGWHFAKPSGAPTQYTFLDFHLPPGQLLLGSICNSWLPANAIKGEGGLRTKDEGPSCSQAAIALKLIFIDTFLPAPLPRRSSTFAYRPQWPYWVAVEKGSHRSTNTLE